jgi:2-polyprenyl-6-methoxyphenol hydroxylase-like FAD-dependent oxidoreductase
MIETDVLIVGSGPAGSSAGLALSTYGIPNMIVTKYGWLANTPRAHLNNQRTMEILRDLGVEPEVIAKASPQDILGNAVFCTSLAGEELGRLRMFGTEPRRRADHTLASPCSENHIPARHAEAQLVEEIQHESRVALRSLRSWSFRPTTIIGVGQSSQKTSRSPQRRQPASRPHVRTVVWMYARRA